MTVPDAPQVEIGKEHCAFAFDPSAHPAASARSGQIVRFHCRDCYDEQIDHDGKEFSQLDMKRNNPVTGPLYIEGAEPGDALKIEIISIEPEEAGVMCVRTGKGVYQVEGCHCRRFPVKNGVVFFDAGIEIPVQPMIGVIGTCPAIAEDTQSPGEHGGNLDMRDLGAGATLYLPVFVPGALLSVGDLHAVQGDGETAICAMEVNGTVTLRVELIKGGTLFLMPFIVTGDAHCALAAHELLDICSVEAARRMHGWLIKAYELTDAQAALLLSLCGNLRITQVVNPRKGCAMELPQTILNQLKARK